MTSNGAATMLSSNLSAQIDPGNDRFGILSTIGACRHARAQAAILGRCLALRFPGVPLAVVGRAADIRGLERSGWQQIASADPRLQHGFESKLCLNEYSPFHETLYLDSDVLPAVPGVDRPEEFIAPLRSCSAPVAYYAAWKKPGECYQGTAIAPLQARAGISGLYCTEGGGHYFWRRGPAANAVFERARQIAAEKWPEVRRFNEALSGASRTSDEVVMAIALALLHPTARLPGGAGMQASYEYSPRSQSTFVHFMADLNPLLYHRLATENLGEHVAPAVASGWYLGKTLRRGVMRLARGGWQWRHLRRLITVDPPLSTSP